MKVTLKTSLYGKQPGETAEVSDERGLYLINQELATADPGEIKTAAKTLSEKRKAAAGTVERAVKNPK